MPSLSVQTLLMAHSPSPEPSELPLRWLLIITSERAGSECLSSKFPVKAIAIFLLLPFILLQVLIVFHLLALVEEMTAWLVHCFFPTFRIHTFHRRRIIACLASLTAKGDHVGLYLFNCQKSAQSLLVCGRAFKIDDEGIVGSFPILVALTQM